MKFISCTQIPNSSGDECDEKKFQAVSELDGQDRLAPGKVQTSPDNYMLGLRFI